MSDSKPQPVTPAAPESAPEARFEWSNSPFENFLEAHFKKLAIGLAAVAIGVGGWLILRQQSDRTLTTQAQAFTGSESLDDYKKVIANHPGSVAAGSAQLMIANLLAQNNDVAGALEELQKFTAAHPQHPMIDQAAFRVAVFTAEKDGAEAGVAAYETFINQYPNSTFRPMAQMRKADALVTLGRRDDALAVYDTIQKDTTLYGNAITEAEERAKLVKLTPPTEVEFVPDPDPVPAADPGFPGLDFDLPGTPAPTPEGAAVPADPAAEPAEPAESEASEDESREAPADSASPDSPAAEPPVDSDPTDPPAAEE